MQRKHHQHLYIDQYQHIDVYEHVNVNFDEHQHVDYDNDYSNYHNNADHNDHTDDYAGNYHCPDNDPSDDYSAANNDASDSYGVDDHGSDYDFGNDCDDNGHHTDAAASAAEPDTEAEASGQAPCEAAGKEAGSTEAPASGVHSMTSLATIVSAMALVSSHSAPAVLPVGAPLGTLKVPSIGLTTPIDEGSMEMYIGNKQYLPELTNGPAHYPANALPWQRGTVAFAGHRVSNTQPFRNLGNIRIGAAVVIHTRWGTYWYKVVPPPQNHAYYKNGYPLETSPCALRKACGVVWDETGWFFRWHKRGHWLVLTACTPQHDYHYRLLVFAKLMGVSRA